MLDRRASLSIEILLASMIFALCSMLSVQAFALFSRAQKNNHLCVVDQGIMAIQELIALSEWQIVEEDQIELLYLNQTVKLYAVNRRVIRTPGTVIYLNEVDDVKFSVEEELLYLNFMCRGKDYRYVIGKKEWWRD